MGFFSPWMIGSFLISLAMAWHIIRTGRSPMWLMSLALVSFLSFAGMALISWLGTIAIWIGYLVVAVIPDLLRSDSARRFKAGVVKVTDPGRDYRVAKRNVDLVGSMDSKRALAEECIRGGKFADAIALYEDAMVGPLGASDPALLKGLGRARMLSGDGPGAEAQFVKLKEVDPAAFDADAELDYARALALQGKNDEAVAQYEKVVSRYPGEEARARFGLLLESMGQGQRAQALFAEIIASVDGAPSYYRSRQREWAALARSHIK